MARVKFTESNLKALTAKPRARTPYFDILGSGLAIRVSGPAGRREGDAKTFGIPYRGPGGVQRWFTLKPDYPALPLKEAKKQAIQILARVALGEDPAADRARARAQPAEKVHTMATVAAAFCDVLPHRTNKTGRRLSSEHIAATTRYLKQAADHWGNRDIATIEQKDILVFLDAIGAIHSVAANRAHAALRTMYGWAEQRGLAPKGVMVGLKRVGSERARDRVLNDTEIALVWQAATALSYPAGHFTKTLLAVGQRVTETSRLRHQHIEDHVWVKSAAETKTDSAHTVPFNSLACEILDDCPQIVDGYVFAGRNPRRPITAFSSLKARLDAKVAEICRAEGRPTIEAWTLHDLRRTCATHLAGLGVDHRIIQKILNHAEESVTGRVYNLHRYDKQKREALELWARKLRDLVNPPPDNLVKLQSRIAR
jgi:integrase